jgi:hypothetical protein
MGQSAVETNQTATLKLNLKQFKVQLNSDAPPHLWNGTTQNAA